ncbi:4'-phosphopantetheinyl transferase superfamily protein [Streptomyces sp. NPDC002763]|uniref:holo-ACP synthase n=1 Tax=Streptomyces sp. NPDC002763 TaxID=3154427 RepID=UPI00332EC913
MALTVRPGVDVLGMGELDRLSARPWFLEYAYSDWERAFAAELGATRRREFLAGRFAAKEAVVKALGRGFGGGIQPRCVEIHRRRDGAPQVRLHGAAADLADTLAASVHVSIAHKGDLVVAVAFTSSCIRSAPNCWPHSRVEEPPRCQFPPPSPPGSGSGSADGTLTTEVT